MVLKILGSLESFFGRFVPASLKRVYFLGFRYSVFVFGGLLGWLILVASDQFLLRFGFWRGFSYATGLVLAILFTFTYHRYITFAMKSEIGERFLKFAPLQVVIAAANWALFLATKGYLEIPDVSSASVVTSFVITFVLSLVNFAANRLFIFRKADARKSL